MISGLSQQIKIFTGSAYPALARSIANFVGIPMGAAEVGRFSDGEISVKIQENIRGWDVFIVQPTFPPGDNLLELLILLDACRRASARRITAVIPYFGYARQDRKDESRVPITAKLVANLITAAGADRVLTMDLHSAQIQGFFDIPLDHMYGSKIFVPYFLKNKIKDLVVVAPDIGGIKLVRAYSRRLGTDLAIVEKRRVKANVAKAMNVLGDVEGKNILLVDDMVDTAGTLCEASRALKNHGAEEIVAAAVHPILSGEAYDLIEASPIKKLFVADTIPYHGEGAAPDWLVRLSVTEVFAEGITRIYREESISSLFI
ncbi:MAG: ribose-phosphate pyrophosphokinase [Candidatus Electryonea clarkiae]|nr:ribose-phosphate pyrophosphokinase [Candidatus Electryonea clarkiae]MDP8286513.1 ribose-phosphate pyrophosphokinase [Candidatus Electryonea clarkiae]